MEFIGLIGFCIVIGIWAGILEAFFGKSPYERHASAKRCARKRECAPR